jgi:hypothetical protein
MNWVLWTWAFGLSTLRPILNRLCKSYTDVLELVAVGNLFRVFPRQADTLTK